MITTTTASTLLMVAKREHACVSTSCPRRNAARQRINVIMGHISNGKVKVLKEGFGFIDPTSGGQNMFFFHLSLLNADFNQLGVGDRVRYRVGKKRSTALRNRR